MPTKAGQNQQQSEKSLRDQPTRTRVSRACDRCRSKKDKCDGARPRCSSCANLGQPCTYDPSTKKRGLPEGYVRGLEKLWGLAIRKVDGMEDVMATLINRANSPSNQLRDWGQSENQLMGQTLHEQKNNGVEDLLERWNDERVEEYLHETWKDSPVSRELEKLLSSIESDEKGAKRKRERDEDDDTHLKTLLSEHHHSEYSVIRKQSTVMNERPVSIMAEVDAGRVSPIIQRPPGRQVSLMGDTEIGGASPRTQRLSTYEELSRPPKRIKAGQLTTPPTALKLPQDSSQLLDLYFTHTHCWLPIMERHDILRVSYHYSENRIQSPPAGTGSGVHAALWAILAYTHLQSGSQTLSPAGYSVNQTGTSSEELYNVARGFIPSEDGIIEVGHVQALILLSLINVGQGKWTSAWVLIGHAVRLALDLNLGHSSNDDGVSKRRDKHVFLACFMVDTLISAHLERCSHLRKEDAELAGHVEEDGLEEWDLWTDNNGLMSMAGGLDAQPPRRNPTFALSTFNRAIELCGLLNDIARDMSSDREAFCARLSQRLQSWHDRLPEVYRRGSDGSSMELSSTLLPHQLYLHLSYITTLLSLHFHSYPHRKAFESPDRRLPDIFAHLPCRISLLLKQLTQTSKITVLPPIFVSSISLSIKSATRGRPNFGAQNLSFTEWTQKMFQSISELEKIWPVFSPLRQTLTSEWQLGNENFLLSLADSQPTQGFDGDTPVNMTGVWIPNQTPEPHSFESPIQAPSLGKKPSQPSIGRSTDLHRHSQATQALPPFSTPPDSRNEGSPLDQSSYRASMWAIPDVGPTSSMQATLLSHDGPPTQLARSSSDFDVDMSELEQVPTNLTDLSAVGEPNFDDLNFMTDDVDAIFRDLAHLDTTEWTNNREQGLKDFGFADDSTFRAFCNDPERLVSGSAFFQTSPSADMWPAANAPDRHLEASQILQSLSGTEQFQMLSDHRAGW